MAIIDNSKMKKDEQKYYVNAGYQEYEFGKIDLR